MSDTCLKISNEPSDVYLIPDIDGDTWDEALIVMKTRADVDCACADTEKLCRQFRTICSSNPSGTHPVIANSYERLYLSGQLLNKPITKVILPGLGVVRVGQKIKVNGRTVRIDTISGRVIKDQDGKPSGIGIILHYRMQRSGVESEFCVAVMPINTIARVTTPQQTAPSQQGK